MKLVSYAINDRRDWGAITPDNGVISGRKVSNDRFLTLKSALAALGVDGFARMIGDAAPDHDLTHLRLLPPIPDPEHIYCAGINYLAHAREVEKDAPQVPRIFLRTASSLIGHGAGVERPKVSGDLDYEGELAVIVGRGGRHIAAESAMDHVAGFTCFMDGSIRDYQKNTTTAGKNFHATGAMGPYLVTSDEAGDWRTLTLETRLNGNIVQSATTDAMLVPIPELLAYVSSISILKPGDIIVTGTPEGIGCRREPPLWMKPGDAIEVSISRVGTLRNPVIEEV